MTNQLSGGVNSDNRNSEELRKLQESKARMAVGKKIVLRKKDAGDKKERSAVALVQAWKNYAKEVFEFAVPTSQFLRDHELQVGVYGRIIELDQYGDTDLTIGQQRDYCEQTIADLEEFSYENDDVLREEAQNPVRKTFIEALASLPRYAIRLGLIVSDVINAETRDELEEIMESTTDSSGEGSQQVFVPNSTAKAPFRVFDRRYGMNVKAFSHLSEFAFEKLKEMVNSRAEKLAAAQREASARLMERVRTIKPGRVSVAELLTGEAMDFNERSALVSWTTLQGHYNAFELRRLNDRLYIEKDVVAKPEVISDLNEMAREWDGEDLFVRLDHMLVSEGGSKYLRPGKVINKAPVYDFGRNFFGSTWRVLNWIRAGIGWCVPETMFLEKDQTRPTKDEVEQSETLGRSNGKKPKVVVRDRYLTDKEIFDAATIYLGEYELVFLPGFEFRPMAKSKASGRILKITAPAVAWVTRLEVMDEVRISLDDVSTQELRQLLLAGDAETEKTYIEGEKGFNLPVGLKLGFKQSFKRYVTK